MTSASAAQRRTRPRFSRADVIQAGVAVTAERGLSGLTLTAVAQRLQVRRPSLYHHVPGGLDELRAGVIDAISEIPTASEDEGEAGLPVGQPLEPTVTDWAARALHRLAGAMKDYPDVIQYLVTQGRNEHRSLDEANRLAALMERQTLSTPTEEAFVIMHAYLVGWICALRPDAAAAEAAGMRSLAAVLRKVETFDSEQILMDGFRALLTGLGAGPAEGAD